MFTWTNLLVVVAELDGGENEALDLVPLVTNAVLEVCPNYAFANQASKLCQQNVCVFFVPFFQCFGSGSFCPESGSYFFPEPVSWSGQNPDPDPWKKRTKILNTRQIFYPKGIIVWICFYILCYTNFPKNCRILIWKIKRITDPVTQLCELWVHIIPFPIISTNLLNIHFIYVWTYLYADITRIIS